ncbi:MAG TPA: Kdo hydroxylase family protein, partial [Pseudacidobacterium sp.]|nr:Kdo hydroxylase family protein [Pseudacidobacterium sp.]
MSVIPISIEDLASRSPEQTQQWCAQLEAGDILYFPQTPIVIPQNDIEFLLGQQQTDSSLHKNIAYKPNSDKLSGVDTKTANAQAVER